jgi:hypothetical protein
VRILCIYISIPKSCAFLLADVSDKVLYSLKRLLKNYVSNKMFHFTAKIVLIVGEESIRCGGACDNGGGGV